MRQFVALAILLLALPAAAQAQVELRRVGTADFQAQGDGERYTAWSDDGTTVVMDDRGPTRSFATTTLDCQRRHPAAPPQVLAVGSGRVATDLCPPRGYGPPTLEMRHLASGGIARAEDPFTGRQFLDVNNRDTTAQVQSVGTHWVETLVPRHHGERRMFVNWRRGTIVDDTGDLTKNANRTVFPDVDARTLYRPLCRPLRRPPNPNNHDYHFGPDLADFEYRRPYAVTYRGSALVLRRCGSTRARVLSRCRAACTSVTLGSRGVTWADSGERAYGYILRSRRRLVLARVADPRRISHVAQTGRRVVVTYHTGDVNGRAVHVGRLPAR